MTSSQAERNGIPDRGRDGVEMTMLDLWRELLVRPALGLHDDFFASGGHSLLAIRLVVGVRRLFGVDLTADDLLSAATVAELAEIVRTGAGAPTPLVRIKGGDPDLPPVYALPPVSGTVLLYPLLARAMPPEQPVWGLQSLGLLPGQQALETVEEIAATFIEHLRPIHPGGPYHLLGYSMGGILAYEVARQLAASDEQVGLVGLLDTRSVVEASDDPDFALRALLWRGLRLELDLEHLRQLSEADRTTLLLTEAVKAGTVPSDFDGERLRRMIDMYSHNLAALSSYEVPPYAGQVVVFRVTDRSIEEPALPDDLGWGAFADEVKVEHVPGDHFSMIETGNVEVLGERVQAHVGRLNGAVS